MTESADQPATPDPELATVAPDAIRHIIKGLVGIGITAEQLAAFEQELFSDIWKHEMHTLFPRLDRILENKFRDAVVRRIKKLAST